MNLKGQVERVRGQMNGVIKRNGWRISMRWYIWVAGPGHKKCSAMIVPLFWLICTGSMCAQHVPNSSPQIGPRCDPA